MRMTQEEKDNYIIMLKKISSFMLLELYDAILDTEWCKKQIEEEISRRNTYVNL